MVDVDFTRITMKSIDPKCLREGRYKVPGEQEGTGKQRKGGKQGREGGEPERWGKGR